MTSDPTAHLHLLLRQREKLSEHLPHVAEHTAQAGKGPYVLPACLPVCLSVCLSVCLFTLQHIAGCLFVLSQGVYMLYLTCLYE